MKKALPSFLFHFPLLAQFDLIASGRAIQFDGVNDYVDMGDIYDDLTFPLSISAWVYAQPSSRYMLPVFASQDNASLYNGFWFCLTSQICFSNMVMEGEIKTQHTEEASRQLSVSFREDGYMSPLSSEELATLSCMLTAMM